MSETYLPRNRTNSSRTTAMRDIAGNKTLLSLKGTGNIPRNAATGSID
jgi:hypothetical protein